MCRNFAKNICLPSWITSSLSILNTGTSFFGAYSCMHIFFSNSKYISENQIEGSFYLWQFFYSHLYVSFYACISLSNWPAKVSFMPCFLWGRQMWKEASCRKIYTVALSLHFHHVNGGKGGKVNLPPKNLYWLPKILISWFFCLLKCFKKSILEI